MEQREVLKWH